MMEWQYKSPTYGFVFLVPDLWNIRNAMTFVNWFRYYGAELLGKFKSERIELVNAKGLVSAENVGRIEINVAPDAGYHQDTRKDLILEYLQNSGCESLAETNRGFQQEPDCISVKGTRANE